ncbi:SIR2 family NAD-dependent protein deacylase [Comamonas aquatica]|uniref:SIR2 family NAD-dependent protein deacylase n=1 Tax=Comamonas aquatica TaxID=225991 RepID=UPI003CFBF010
MSSESVEAEAQVHLLSIRKALANRNAAVMVGAGFSRNAEGGQNLATWRQLSEALANELEPERKPGAFAPAAASQLAEQYARVFSPTHLEQLIKRCVPDDQVTPGRLHAQLLELPWSEVFTTNYDTLLERAAERLFDASYFTVCAREDIPQSKVLGRRRIVKLHGSFPSHRPFILTEEEYRTYPDRFAPFVNLVRQSLLENVFCLIGFSGDDPNFLHWLGWVRDMLDKHALPVYLFLAQEPTLGERKLYESRGVIPVVLPIPEGKTSDYQARYQALFTELARPLADSPLDWGDCSISLSENSLLDMSGQQQFVQLLKQLPELNAYRSSYPGWIVAPQKIRTRFHRTAGWVKRTLDHHNLRNLLIQRPASVILAIVEIYGWAQSVMLEPWNDEVAELGLSALSARNVAESVQPTPDELAFLTAMDCTDAAKKQITWVEVGLALISWARQGHRMAAYEKIRAQLQIFASDESVVQERLIYEDILMRLQQGDQPGALQQVLAWRPKGSDAYVHVLRGSLLAEVGETTTALAVLEQAIQMLRRQQRSRPGNSALISQEAWACLIARNAQRALEFDSQFTNRSSLTQSKEEAQEAAGEDFEHRLNALGARGYSADQELKSLIADLNAEAPLPQIAQSRLRGFDLGSGSSRLLLTHASELRDKINASLAWLELIERTGLFPQTRNVSFFVEQLLQAAWWARFADTPQRSIGLLLRAHRENALKPRDSSLPFHRSGWLARQEVARFSAEAASELCAELMKQVCAEFESSIEVTRSKPRAKFLLKVFSHLVIRVQNEATLEGWGKQLLELHHISAVRVNTALWEPLSRALGRILEALPGAAQLTLILRAFNLPLTPDTPASQVPRHEIPQWLNANVLLKHWNPNAHERSGAEWRQIVLQLIQQLRRPPSEVVAQQAWHRLFALRDKGIVNEAEKKEVGAILWESAEPKKWPTIPGYFPSATLMWPAPRRDASSQFLNRMLERPLRPFNSGGYMQMTIRDGSRSYFLGGLDSTLGTICQVMRQTSLTLSQIDKLINVVNEWLDYQLNGLVLDLVESQLFDECFRAVSFLDDMLAQCVTQLGKRSGNARVTALLKRIVTLDDRLQALSFPRYDLGIALIRCDQRDVQKLDEHLRSLIEGLAVDNAQVVWRAANAIYGLLKEESSQFHTAAKTVFDIVVSCVFAQRTTCIEQGMDLLAQLPPTAWHRNLDEKSLTLLDIALTDLASKLTYTQQEPVDIESDELVPRLRSRAFKLAYAMIHTANAHSHAAQRWLDAAKDDPLPEGRLGRFKHATERVD